MVDMSLTKFWQFFTNILIMYWLLIKPNYRPPANVSSMIFSVLCDCQAVHLLDPTFHEEHILIGMILLISHQCHLSSTNSSNKLQKLKKKLALLQITLNN